MEKKNSGIERVSATKNTIFMDYHDVENLGINY